MEEKKLNIESVLNQFEVIEQSIKRAKLPFEVNMLPQTSLDVSLYELMRTIQQSEDLIREIGYPRFEPIASKSIYHPPLVDFTRLQVCNICGSPECQSDHK